MVTCRTRLKDNYYPTILDEDDLTEHNTLSSFATVLMVRNKMIRWRNDSSWLTQWEMPDSQRVGVRVEEGLSKVPSELLESLHGRVDERICRWSTYWRMILQSGFLFVIPWIFTEAILIQWHLSTTSGCPATLFCRSRKFGWMFNENGISTDITNNLKRIILFPYQWNSNLHICYYAKIPLQYQ